MAQLAANFNASCVGVQVHCNILFVSFVCFVVKFLPRCFSISICCGTFSNTESSRPTDRHRHVFRVRRAGAV